MAQAGGLADLLKAGGGGGSEEAPRNNKTTKEYKGMNTQNERNAIPEGQFHWLENIQPIGPGNLHSIPGRSIFGVEIPQPTPPPPELCTDATERGQQSLAVELAFDQGTIAGNLRTSWAHVESGVLISMVGEAGCGGGNMNYQTFVLPPVANYNCSVQCNYGADDGTGPESFAAVVDPQEVPAINTRMGTGDQQAYGFTTNGVNGLSVSYPDENLRHVYEFAPNVSGGSAFDSFGFHDSQLYSIDTDSTDGKRRLLEYDRVAGGAPTNTAKPWGSDNVHVDNINVTADRIICPVFNSTTGTRKIYFIKRSDLSVDTTKDITNVPVFYMFAVNNNLQYLLTDLALYYYNATQLVYVGKAAGIVISAFSASGYFNDGKMYFGGNGFGGLDVNVYKIAVACPSGSPPVAIVAAVATGGTVSAGSSINVTFGPILEPDANDKLQLAPEVAGQLGFAGPTAVQQSTASAASGTISFTIPGGTTPGTYRIQLVANSGNVYIARSNTFTVT